MAFYSKGASYERELMAILCKKGFAVARIAGSGKAKTEEPDLIAGNNRLIMAIECKYSSTKYKTVKKEQVNDLFNFSKCFGAKAILAFRFPHSPWKFMEIKEAVNENVSIKKTDKLIEMNELIC
ncbi:MAG: Holliday junction resolvase Hjc, partial [Candidatus Nanoarchaeia archaeon]|nr:Holliday junction resolvase Hjc [Candidatus Nanoarchaeia archaeon]